MIVVNHEKSNIIVTAFARPTDSWLSPKVFVDVIGIARTSDGHAHARLPELLAATKDGSSPLSVVMPFRFVQQKQKHQQRAAASAASLMSCFWAVALVSRWVGTHTLVHASPSRSDPQIEEGRKTFRGPRQTFPVNVTSRAVSCATTVGLIQANAKFARKDTVDRPA